jgi:hypothetical protein
MKVTLMHTYPIGEYKITDKASALLATMGLTLEALIEKHRTGRLWHSVSERVQNHQASLSGNLFVSYLASSTDPEPLERLRIVTLRNPDQTIISLASEIDVYDRVIITEGKYNAIHSDYRSVWTTERTDFPDWDSIRDQLMGKRTLMRNFALHVEGMTLAIIPDA